MKNKFWNLSAVILLIVLLLTGVVIYFQYGNSTVGNFPIEINKNRPIGLVFVGGLNMDEKKECFEKGWINDASGKLVPYC